ncbi:MAG: protein kinase [Acidimicrobiales bacterium]
MTGDLGALPSRFGRYEVLGLIGRGSFADVARAWDDALAAHVAVKVLNEEAAADELIRRRFVEEGQLLRRVRSDNVVGVHDLGVLDDGRPYLVLDFADGGTLADRLQAHGGQVVDAETASRIVEALAAGMEALHRAGIVHRDIKPENLLIDTTTTRADADADTVLSGGVLDPGERLLIGDLGLAKDLSSRGALPSVIGGSARYQAPEQLRVDGELGPATDVYAASAVLWLLLSGRLAPEPHDVSSELIMFTAGWQGLFAPAMDMNPAARVGSAVAWRSAVLDRLAAEPRALADDTSSMVYDRACPYKGLASFQPEDADLFFGREDLVDELLRRLQMARVLVVAGPSGSGKSSVVRAGLLPSLRAGALPGSNRWRVEMFTPGPDPIDELHYRLTRGSGRATPAATSAELARDPRLARRLLDDADHDDGWVLYVDQFEELFTLSGDGATAQLFVDALSAMVDPADSRLRVVLAVRADFYGRCAHIPWLATRITENQVLVGPMSNASMRRAIEEPARRRGLRLEPGLVETVLDEGGRRVASLPLISHALMETWARRDGNVLTLEGFRAAGGVAGAISRSADDLVDEKFDERHQRAARRLLLRLITPGEGTADTRRILSLAALGDDSDVEAITNVVDEFVAARLLTVDERSVEIAHEALIAGWPRLRDWVDAERENLRYRQRVGRATTEWMAAGRDPDLLWRGTPLATAVEWAAEHGDDLDVTEREFIERAESARIAARAEEARSRARAQRLRRLATAALSLLTTASIVASIGALLAFQRAQSNAEVAERQFANALGTSAFGRADVDPAQALLLAVESIERSPTPGVDARSGLIRARLALATSGVVPLGPPIATPGSFQVALRPDGALAAVADQTGPVRLYDIATGEQMGDDLVRHERGARSMAFTADGNTLITAAIDGLVLVWDLTDPAAVPPPRVLAETGRNWGLALSPDDREVAVADDRGIIHRFDLATGAEGEPMVWDDEFGVTTVAYSPDGSTLVAANREGRLLGWARATDQPIWEGPTAPGPYVKEIRFSPSGDWLAVAGDGDVVVLHDAATGRLVPGGELGDRPGTGSDVTRIIGVAFLPDGSGLLGGDGAGKVRVWDLSDLSAEPTGTAAGHGGRVRHGDLSADGTVYVTVGDDKGLRAWRTASVPVASRIGDLPGGAFGAAFAPDGRRLAVGDGAGSLHLFDLPADGWAAGERAAEVTSVRGHEGAVFDVAWSPDGTTVASIGDDGMVVLWNPADAAPVATLGRHRGAGRSVTFSPDGARLVSSDQGDENGEGASVLVWNVAGQSLAAELPSHIQGVRTTAWSDDGDLLATADGRGEVAVWSGGDLSEIARWRSTEQVNPVWGLAFGPEGLLASVDSSENLRVWDPRSGEQIGRSTGGLGTHGATGVGFDRSGETIAAATRTGELHLIAWRQGIDLAGRPIPAHGPDADIFELAFAPDGERFVTTGTDGVVAVWDILVVDRACAVAAERLDPAIAEDLFATADPIACR